MSDETGKNRYEPTLAPLDPKAYKEDMRAAYETARAREKEHVNLLNEQVADLDSLRAKLRQLEDELSQANSQIAGLQAMVAEHRQESRAIARASELALRVMQQVSKLTDWELTSASSTTTAHGNVNIDLWFGDWHLRIIPDVYMWLELKGKLQPRKVDLDEDGISDEGFLTFIGYQRLAEMSETETERLPAAVRNRTYIDTTNTQPEHSFSMKYADIARATSQAAHRIPHGDLAAPLLSEPKMPGGNPFNDKPIPEPHGEIYGFTRRSS